MKQTSLSFLLLLLISFFSEAWAQPITVKGQVTDESGETLPGVNVQIEGTSEGTVADFDGNYSLEVPSSDVVLIFSFIGYETKEVPLNGRSILNVTLSESVQELKEVVVTALGVEKDKKSLGYAAQNVGGEELMKARETNVINSLSGRVSGVQINQSGTGPGGTSKVVIRGYSSIGGSNSPLYVIDGVPMTNPQGGGGQFGGIDYGDGISNINPEDIETISVLKGASATSLYGSRGQNGVIMITTKKGKARKGIGVEYNGSVMFESPLILPDFQNRFGRGSNGNFPLDENGNILNGIRTSWGERTRGQTEFNGNPIVNWTGEPTPYSAQPDNISGFFRLGSTVSNSLAFSGGTEKTQARVSITHMQRENIMPNSNLERLGVNLNINSQLTNKLSFQAKINYLNQQAFNRPNLTLSPDNPMKSLIEMPRTIRLEDLQDFRTETGMPRVYTNATGNDNWQNPYWAVNLNTNDDERDRVIGFVMLEYKFTDWLKIHVRSGTDFYNDFRQLRNATNTIYRVTPDKSFYSQYYGRVQETNTDFLVTYTKDIGSGINLSANIGGNLLRITSRSILNQAQGLDIPNFFSLQNALDVLSSEADSEREIQSLYGSAQLDYKGFWFLELAARNDWSSTLPPDNNSYFYPALSTSLVFTDMLELNWGSLSYGKIRGSVAQVGNDTGPYQLDQQYAVNTLAHGGQTFAQIINVQPPVNLKPEKTTSVELGMELAFFLNRLSMDFTYYHAGTRNQILAIPVSKPSGYIESRVNAGLVNNSGVEFTIKGTPIETEDWRYEAYINFSHNRSKVVELAENVELYQLGGTYDQFGVRIQAEVGGEFGDIYADRSFLKDPETGERVIGSNGLPIPNPEGIEKIGNFQPDFLAGFGHNLRYKNWTLNALFDIRKGGDIFSFTNAVSAANGNAKYTEDNRLEWYFGAGGHVAEGIRENGTPNTIEVNPQTYYQFVGGRASAFAEEFIYDGSFIKLRELTLGYSFPQSMLENTFISRASISLVGRNLFMLYKNTIGFDPEATFNAGNDQGIEAYAFPSTRSYGFNINISL